MLILKEMLGDTKGVIRRRFEDGRKIQWPKKRKIVHTMMIYKALHRKLTIEKRERTKN
jgi:hypothetical protein